MVLYDRMRALQLAREALTLQLNEAKARLGDEHEKKSPSRFGEQ